MKPRVSLRKALSDPALIGTVIEGPSWKAWRTLLIASMGEELTDDERAIFRQLTGREREPGARVEEFVGVIGRRGGKSRAMSVLATYIAGLCDHRDVLARGESGVLLCVAPDQRQAAITLDYATAAFESTPFMRQLIANRTSDALTLTTGVSIEVRAASFRRLRGPTYIAVIADEAAFWPSDDGSANPDTAILNAVRPGLATTRGPLIVISSPHARRGEVWEAHKRHFGSKGDPLILVAQAPSRVLNPSLPQSVVDRALERDEAAARAEFLAEFRSDLEAYIAREVVEACVTPGVFERPPVSGVTYRAFADPAGGSGSDAMTLAIGHKESDRAVVDAIRVRKPPFAPSDVVSEFGATLKTYGVTRVQGDRYAGSWPAERFAEAGITYEPAAAPKSDLYRDLVPTLNSGAIDLLDHATLINQLVSLERRVARSGKDSIDHPPNGHDDVANCVAGLASMIAANADTYDESGAWMSDTVAEAGDTNRAWRAAAFRRHIFQ